MKNIFLYSPPVEKAEFELKSDGANTENKTDMEKVSRKIAENKRYVEETFSVPLNGDIVVRDFKIFVGSKSYDAFFVICDGLADGDSVNECVLKPFMYLKNSVVPKGEALDKIITGALLPQNARDEQNQADLRRSELWFVRTFCRHARGWIFH